MTRKDLIQKIEESWVIDESEVAGCVQLVSTSFRSLLLKNPLTKDYCQILEAVHNISEDKLNANYFSTVCAHRDCYVTFVQLNGFLYFKDGTFIGPHETKVIKPHEVYSCKLEKDGVCIVMLHPKSDEFQAALDSFKDSKNLGGV